jgi:hypothetical protein
MLDADQLNKIKDEEHLKMLVLFNRIYGVIKILFSILFIVYINFIINFLKGPEFYSRFPTPENFHFPPQIFLGFIFLIMSIMVVIQFLFGILSILSAQFIHERKYRTFSILVACVNCISFPLGTAIGAFTIIVLYRNSVISLYNPRGSSI